MWGSSSGSAFARIGHSSLIYGGCSAGSSAGNDLATLNQLQSPVVRDTDQQPPVGPFAYQPAAVVRSEIQIHDQQPDEFSIIDCASSGQGDHDLQYHHPVAADATSRSAQSALTVPDLGKWWRPTAGGASGFDDDGNNNACRLHWSAAAASDEQLQGIPERDLIIVKRTSGTVNTWPDSTNCLEYECRICGRRCKWRSSISVHVRTHTGRKPYQCRVCSQSFADSSTRKKHEKKTHGCEFSSSRRKTDSVEVQAPRGQLLASSPQHESALHSSWQCRLCFALLETKADLGKHLYEFHNQVVPRFQEAFGASSCKPGADAAELRASSNSSMRFAQQPPPPCYLPDGTIGGCFSECGDCELQPQPEADAAEQPHEQCQQGIPLPTDTAADPTGRDGCYPDALLMVALDNGAESAGMHDQLVESGSDDGVTDCYNHDLMDYHW